MEAWREQLVIDHDYIAEIAARSNQMKDHDGGSFNPLLKYEDMLQEARVGLVQAAGSFDPEAGASFPTHAWLRVRGAVVDAKRRVIWGGRYRAAAGEREPHEEDPSSLNLEIGDIEGHPIEMTELLTAPHVDVLAWHSFLEFLATLEPREARMVLMILGGWKQKDVAEVLGVSQGRVTQLMVRCREKFEAAA